MTLAAGFVLMVAGLLFIAVVTTVRRLRKARRR